MSFAESLRHRSAQEYAGFFTEHLPPRGAVLDCGCGEGAITTGLAQRAPGERVVGRKPARGA